MAWRAVRSDASMDDLMSHQFMKEDSESALAQIHAKWLLSSAAGAQVKRGTNKVTRAKPKKFYDCKSVR